MMHIRVIFSAPIGVLAVVYISVTSAPIDLAQSRMPTSVAPCQRSKKEERHVSCASFGGHRCLVG
jgi:hypothetical protein